MLPSDPPTRSFPPPPAPVQVPTPAPAPRVSLPPAAGWNWQHGALWVVFVVALVWHWVPLALAKGKPSLGAEAPIILAAVSWVFAFWKSPPSDLAGAVEEGLHGPPGDR